MSTSPPPGKEEMSTSPPPGKEELSTSPPPLKVATFPPKRKHHNRTEQKRFNAKQRRENETQNAYVYLSS